MIAYHSHGVTAPVRFNNYKDSHFKYGRTCRTLFRKNDLELIGESTYLINFLVILVSLAKNVCSIMG